MKSKQLTFIFTFGIAIFAAGCSSSGEQPDRKKFIYQERLETKILPDGSKVFNFSLAMQRREGIAKNEKSPDENLHKNGKRGEKGGRTGERKRGQRNAEQNQEIKSASAVNEKGKGNQALAERFEERLDNLKILKMFCRQGYFVLEEYSQVNKMSIKAECMEGASAADYNKFTKAK